MRRVRRSAHPLGDMAPSINSTWVRRAALAGGTIVLPVGILSAYLVISRWDSSDFSIVGEYLALGGATATGAVCLWHLIDGAQWRPIAMIVYSLACAAALIVFSLSFVCAVFRECL
jgi:hypothetical protein